MSIIRGTFVELFHRRTGISEINMGQRDYYNVLQQAMQQQSQQGISNQGMLGQLGGLANAYGNQLGQANQANPYVNNPQESIYPGKVIHYPDGSNRYGYNRNEIWQKWAEYFGFKEDFDTGGFKHPNGGFVARRFLEDIEGTTKSIESVFKRALTPNMTWLEDRVNEVRVKLC